MVENNLNDDENQKSHKTALKALIFLAAINFLNQVDRRTLVTLFPLIKSEWALSDAQLGFAVTLFTLARSLTALPAGWLADRKGILRILRPSVFLWSALVTLSGWAGSIAAFIGFRTGVGVMDGVNNPLDLAYLGKVSPKAKRGLFLSIYSIALYLGSGMGVIFAGTVGERFGWRWAVIIPGVLGLLIALGLFWQPKQEQPTAYSPQTKSDRQFQWLRSKPIPGIFIGGAFGVFASTALVSWMPSYLVRTFNLSLTRAGLLTGGLIIPASILGALTGGLVSDRLGLHNPRSRYWISFFGLVLAMCFGLGGLIFSDLTIVIIFFLLSSFSFTLPVSPMLVLVQDAVPHDRLATAQAAFGLATQVIGAAPATSLVGLLSDRVGLNNALILPFILAGLGGLIIAFTGLINRPKNTSL